MAMIFWGLGFWPTLYIHALGQKGQNEGIGALAVDHNCINVRKK